MKVLPVEIMRRICARLQRLYGAKAAPRLAERLELLTDRYNLGGTCPLPGAGPLWDQGDALLITYADMVKAPQEPPLATLHRFLESRLRGALSGVHILPFFPYSSDEGFSVIDYRKVDEALGSWEDIHRIAGEFKLMFDLVLNHASRNSAWFANFQAGIAPERDYFIVSDPEADLSAVVRPRTSPLLTPIQTPHGEKWVWTTFSPDQIDLNFANPDVLFEFLDILLLYIQNGARIIRLDAIAYLWKEPGTPCINLPQTHEVVKLLRDVVDMLAPGTLLLTETNLPHEQNISYFGAGDEAHMVYQFSLPPLLLHALYTGNTRYLQAWASGLSAPPPGCTYLNFTASHDGIGVRPLEGLVPAEEIQQVVDNVRHRGGLVSTRSTADGQESPYELNITYFDALGEPGHADTERHIARFLCSQTVMLSLRGIPAVYFHSLTATHNDHVGVDRSGQARAINRRRWEEHELNALLEDPAGATSRVFHAYTRLLRIRSEHRAFHPDGAQRVLDLDEGLFGLARSAPDESETIFAVFNMTGEMRSLDTTRLLPEGISQDDDGSWTELIEEQAVEVRPDGSLELRPYETLWLLQPSMDPTERQSTQ